MNSERKAYRKILIWKMIASLVVMDYCGCSSFQNIIINITTQHKIPNVDNRFPQRRYVPVKFTLFLYLSRSAKFEIYALIWIYFMIKNYSTPILSIQYLYVNLDLLYD